MDSIATSTNEGLARATIGGGEIALSSVAERAFARLAAMADPNQHEAMLNWISNDDLEAHRLCMEEFAPTIDHKRVVTLIDTYGNERVITQPLAVSERFDPATIADLKKRANFEKWIHRNADAKQDRVMTSWMEFVHRVIDDELDAEKPKKARAPKKIEDDPAKAAAQAEAIERAKFKREKPQRERQRRKDRLEVGFVQNNTVIRADRTYLPFSDCYRDADGNGTALPSELGIMGLALYNARLPKDALFGKDKREVYDGASEEALFLRDREYLTIGWWKVRGQLVCDLDGKWKALKQLRKDLVRVLGVGLLPALIVYRLDKDGNIENPHLIWILPPGAEVGVCGKSKSGPVRMFNMIQDALVSALIPLGADPGHTNTGKTKNPLAPRWSVACFENFPDLKDFAAGLPTLAVDRKEMRRRHAKLTRAGDEAEPSQSQYLWNTINDVWKQAITEGFRTHDKAFLSALKTTSSTAYGEWLKAAGIPLIRKALAIAPDTELPDDVRKIMRKQITWRCANRPNPDTKYYDGDNRGRDTLVHEAEGLVGAELPEARKTQGKKRKGAAGTITRANQGSDSRAIIQAQLELYARLGFDLDDKEAVARFIIRSGLREKSCVYKWLKVLLPSFRDASRYIARNDTGFFEQPSMASETTEVAIMPALVDVTVSDATLASAATSRGKPGHDPKEPS